MLSIANFFDEYGIGCNMASQSSFSCSKLTIETLEQNVKYVQI